MTGHAALEDLAWPDVPSGRFLVAALGSLEQHGPHLPLSTDTRIASALVTGLVAARPGQCVEGPALPLGSSGEHQSFAGTLSIGTEVLTHVLVELVRSAAHHWAGVVLVNGHGGNSGAVRSAADLLQAQGHRVLAWAPSLPAGGDLHAGHIETSVMLALAPHLVRADRLAAGATGSLAQLLPAMQSGGVAAVSPSGVLGDPTRATAPQGRALLGAWSAQLLEAFDRWA